MTQLSLLKLAWKGGGGQASCAGQCRLHTTNWEQARLPRQGPPKRRLQNYHSLIFFSLVSALHCLAVQRWRPQSQQTHIPAPSKTTRTKHQLPSHCQPFKSQTLSCKRNMYGCWWLPVAVSTPPDILCKRKKMSGGTIGGWTVFNQRMPVGSKEHQPLALYQFDVDVPVHLQESSQHDKCLSSLISTFCSLADSSN